MALSASASRQFNTRLVPGLSLFWSSRRRAVASIDPLRPSVAGSRVLCFERTFRRGGVKRPAAQRVRPQRAFGHVAASSSSAVALCLLLVPDSCGLQMPWLALREGASLVLRICEAFCLRASAKQLQCSLWWRCSGNGMFSGVKSRLICRGASEHHARS